VSDTYIFLYDEDSSSLPQMVQSKDVDDTYIFLYDEEIYTIFVFLTG